MSSSAELDDGRRRLDGIHGLAFLGDDRDHGAVDRRDDAGIAEIDPGVLDRHPASMICASSASIWAPVVLTSASDNQSRRATTLSAISVDLLAWASTASASTRLASFSARWARCSELRLARAQRVLLGHAVDLGDQITRLDLLAVA